jgi:hypothetical protein
MLGRRWEDRAAKGKQVDGEKGDTQPVAGDHGLCDLPLASQGQAEPCWVRGWEAEEEASPTREEAIRIGPVYGTSHTDNQGIGRAKTKETLRTHIYRDLGW